MDHLHPSPLFTETARPDKQLKDTKPWPVTPLTKPRAKAKSDSGAPTHEAALAAQSAAAAGCGVASSVPHGEIPAKTQAVSRRKADCAN
jgi:hypothetical protein